MSESIEDTVNRLFSKVQDHMKWDAEKTFVWFETENPLLGECTPMDMIFAGRAHKVEQFIDTCIDESKPS